MRLQRHSYSDRRRGHGLVKGFPSIKGTPIARGNYMFTFSISLIRLLSINNILIDYLLECFDYY